MNADDSLTSTLGVGGRPLIAGFYEGAEETKKKQKTYDTVDEEHTDKATTIILNLAA